MRNVPFLNLIALMENALILLRLSVCVPAQGIGSKTFDLTAWCENISIQNNRKVVRKDCRENSLFTTQTIDEAIAIMTESGKITPN